MGSTTRTRDTTTTELGRLRHHLIDGMRRSLEVDDDLDGDSGFEAGYSQAEVDECARIVDDLLASLHEVRGAEDGVLKVVRATVDRLNELNERCDCALIDATQRDELCDLINAAARDAGLKSSPHEDITETWREW
jgi:hypothetical protein